MTLVLGPILLLAALAVAQETMKDGEKPLILFLDKPANILVTENEEAIFKCRVNADDRFPSKITWRRDNGPLPRRGQQDENNSFVIRPVKLHDAGAYICVANNSLDVAKAQGLLTVHSKPSFIKRPKNKSVIAGKNVRLKCSVKGKPDPSLFWSAKGGQLLLFPGQTTHRYSVDAWGTLRIKKVSKDDEGEYECNAISTAGKVAAVAKIKVKQRSLNKTCTDHKGKHYYEGDKYSPEREDPCYMCRCINSAPANCTVLECDHPDCPVWESVRGECCKFRCIDGPTYTTEELNANIRWTARPTSISASSSAQTYTHYKLLPALFTLLVMFS